MMDRTACVAAELSAFLSRGLPVGDRFETRFFANPDAGLVISELEGAVAALDDESTFVFYFAGHGLRLGSNPGQSLLCADAPKRGATGRRNMGRSRRISSRT